MYPERVIVCTHRQADGLSTIPDDLNTLIHQSNGTDNAPQVPTSRPHYMRLF